MKFKNGKWRNWKMLHVDFEIELVERCEGGWRLFGTWLTRDSGRPLDYDVIVVKRKMMKDWAPL